MPERIPYGVAREYFEAYKDDLPSQEEYVQKLEGFEPEDIEHMANDLYEDRFSHMERDQFDEQYDLTAWREEMEPGLLEKIGDFFGVGDDDEPPESSKLRESGWDVKGVRAKLPEDDDEPPEPAKLPELPAQPAPEEPAPVEEPAPQGSREDLNRMIGVMQSEQMQQAFTQAREGELAPETVEGVKGMDADIQAVYQTAPDAVKKQINSVMEKMPEADRPEWWKGREGEDVRDWADKLSDAAKSMPGAFRHGVETNEAGGLAYIKFFGGGLSPEEEKEFQRLKEVTSKPVEHPEGALGATASSVANVVGSMVEGLPAAAIGAGVGGVIGSGGGPPGIIAGVKIGAAGGIFAHSMQVEAGHAMMSALDLLESEGITNPDIELVKGFASLTGLINGALEVIGAGAVTSPLVKYARKKLLKGGAEALMKQPGFRKRLAAFAKDWAVAAGGETSTEILQEITQMMSDSFVADGHDLDGSDVRSLENAIQVTAGIAEEVGPGMAVLALIPGAAGAVGAGARPTVNQQELDEALKEALEEGPSDEQPAEDVHPPGESQQADPDAGAPVEEDLHMNTRVKEKQAEQGKRQKFAPETLNVGERVTVAHKDGRSEIGEITRVNEGIVTVSKPGTDQPIAIIDTNTPQETDPDLYSIKEDEDVSSDQSEIDEFEEELMSIVESFKGDVNNEVLLGRLEAAAKHKHYMKVTDAENRRQIDTFINAMRMRKDKADAQEAQETETEQAAPDAKEEEVVQEETARDDDIQPPKTEVGAIAAAGGDDLRDAPADMGPSPSDIIRVKPEDVLVDAETFQFKSETNEEGVSDRLLGVEEWSPESAGLIILWQNKAGDLYVADGHQRVALARRIKEKTGQDIRLNAIVWREVDNVTAADAKVRAAMKNVREGGATAMDVAKIMRYNPDLITSKTLPPNSALVRDARGLAKLGDNAFGMVVNEILDPTLAAIVGEKVQGRPDNDALQSKIIEAVKHEGLTTRGQVEPFIQQALTAPIRSEQEQGSLMGLMGLDDKKVTLDWGIRSRIIDTVNIKLRSGQRVFKNLIDNEAFIKAAGKNILDDAGNRSQERAYAYLRDIFERSIQTKGPIADAITEAVTKHHGGQSISAVAQGVVNVLAETATEGNLLGDEISGEGLADEGGGAENLFDVAAQKEQQQPKPEPETVKKGDAGVQPGKQAVKKPSKGKKAKGDVKPKPEPEPKAEPETGGGFSITLGREDVAKGVEGVQDKIKEAQQKQAQPAEAEQETGLPEDPDDPAWFDMVDAEEWQDAIATADEVLNMQSHKKDDKTTKHRRVDPADPDLLKELAAQAERDVRALTAQEIAQLMQGSIAELKELKRKGTLDTARGLALTNLVKVMKREIGARTPPGRLKEAHGLEIVHYPEENEWAVQGNTHKHKDSIKSLYSTIRPGRKKFLSPTKTRKAQWRFVADPTAGLIDILGLPPRKIRRNVAKKVDEAFEQLEPLAPLDVAVNEHITKETQQQLAVGMKHGMPAEAIADQVTDAAAIVQAHKQGKSMFLLASQAGSGKTFVMGAAMKEMIAGGVKNILYVTLNEDLIRQNKGQLAPYLGDDLLSEARVKRGDDGVRFITYSKLNREGAKIIKSIDPGTVLIFDEAHNIKNIEDSNRAKLAQHLMKKSNFSVLASATPYENPKEMRYLAVTGVFDDVGGFDEFAEDHGVRIERIQGPAGEIKTYKFVGDRQDSLNARNFMAKQGVFTFRPARLPPNMVSTRFERVEVDIDLVGLYYRVSNAYEIALEMAEGPREPSQIKAHRENLLKRIMEGAKVEEAIELAKGSLEEGKHPVIFVETKAERWVGKFTLSEPYVKQEGIKGEARDHLYTPAEMMVMMERWYAENEGVPWGERGKPPFAPFIVKIAQAMMEAGIDQPLASTKEMIVEALGEDAVPYTGDETLQKAAANKKAFLAGKKKAIVPTMAKGGTGLSLHDTVGDAPRVLIGLNLPWTATVLDQVLGRVARYGMQSEAEILFLYASNVPFEERLAARIGYRMRHMGSILRGEIPIVHTHLQEQVELGQTERVEKALRDLLPAPEIPAESNPEVISALEDTANLMAPGAALEIRNQMRGPNGEKLQGSFTNHGRMGIIKVALDGAPLRSLHHEIIHALRHAGLFTEREWVALKRAVDRGGWIDRYRIREAYPEMFENGKPTEAAYEEAIAEAFADWALDENSVSLTPTPRGLFARMYQFFRRMAEHLRLAGYEVTPESVFGAVREGAVGRRTPGKVRGGRARYRKIWKAGDEGSLEFEPLGYSKPNDVLGLGQRDVVFSRETDEFLLRTKDPSAPHNVHHVAADWVVGKGRRDGFEHIVMVNDADGSAIAGTTHDRASVGFSEKMRHAAFDQSNEIAIHHNHPRIPALSSSDIIMALRHDGVKSIGAYGHEGITSASKYSSISAAKITPAARDLMNFFHDNAVHSHELGFQHIPIMTRVINALFSSSEGPIQIWVWKVLNDGDITKKEAGVYHNEIALRALHNAGIIEYTSTNIDLPVNVHLIKAEEKAERYIRDAIESPQDVLAWESRPNTPPAIVRSRREGMERVFGPVGERARPEGSNDTGANRVGEKGDQPDAEAREGDIKYRRVWQPADGGDPSIEYDDDGNAYFFRKTEDALSAINRAENPHEGAAAWLVRMGKQHDFEHIVFMDLDSGTVEAGTSEQRRQVAYPDSVMDMTMQPGRQVIVHHNHPENPTLSRTDVLYLMGSPGIRSKGAYKGKDMSVATVTTEGKRIIADFDSYWKEHTEDFGINPIMEKLLSQLLAHANIVQRHVVLPVEIAAGRITRIEAATTVREIGLRALHNTGIIEYTSTVQIPDFPIYQEAQKEAENFIKQIVEEAYEVNGHKEEIKRLWQHAPDSRAAPVRGRREGMERVFGPVGERARPEGPTDTGADQDRQGDDSGTGEVKYRRDLPAPMIDPESEARYQKASGGIDRPGILETVGERIETQWHRLVRRFERMESTPENADVLEKLRHLDEAGNAAKNRITNFFLAITQNGKLTKIEIDLFTRKVILEDLLWTAGQGMALPYNLPDRAAVEANLARVNKALARPEFRHLQESLNVRTKELESIRKELIEAGVLDEKRVSNPHYFRHMVLEYAKLKAEMQKASGKKVTTGFWFRREGSEKDINANYFEVEAEWMFKAHTDIATQRFLNWLRNSKYNKRKEFVRKAKRDNDQAMYDALLAEYKKAIKKKSPKSWSKLEKDLDKHGAKTSIALARAISEQRRGYALVREIYKKDQPLLKEYDRFRTRIAMGMDDLKHEVRSLPHDVRNKIPQKFQAALENLMKGTANRGLSDAEENATIWPLLNYFISERDPVFIGASDASGQVLGAIAQRKAWMRKVAIPEQYINTQNTKELVKRYDEDGIYSAWQPDSYDGKTRAVHIYSKKTLPEHVIDRAVDRLDELAHGMMHDGQKVLPMDLQMIRSVLETERQEQRMVGGPKEEFVITHDLAFTLNEFRDTDIANTLDAMAVDITRLWKAWILFSPQRFAKYFFNNMSGDIDALIANPSGRKILAKIPQAAREMTDVMLHGKKPSKAMMLAIQKGVTQSSLTAQEVPDIRTEGFDPEFLTLPKDQQNAAMRAAKIYFRKVRNFAVWRENLVRYAAYLHYREAFARGESMIDIGYGASPAHIVEAITDPDDRAARMARDALGDYGNISHTARWARRRIFPFVSWQFSNTVRYINLFNNAFLYAKHKSALKGGAMAAALGVSIGVRLYARIFVFYGLAQVWNRLMFPDEEDRLSSQDQSRLHVIVGTDAGGNIMMIRFQGALSDFLGWFGFEDAGVILNEVLSGRASLGDVLQSIAKAPVNRIVQGINPLYKVPIELSLGQQFFPDVFNPYQIRDPVRHIARTFALEPEVSEITKHVFKRPFPSRPYRERFAGVLITRRNPGQSAYDNIRSKAYGWRKKVKGKSGGRAGMDARGIAFYNYKLAKKLGDEVSARLALRQLMDYGALGESLRGVKRRARPLGMLTNAEAFEFRQTLSPSEKVMLDRAEQFYRDYILADDGELIREIMDAAA